MEGLGPCEGLEKATEMGILVRENDGGRRREVVYLLEKFGGGE